MLFICVVLISIQSCFAIVCNDHETVCCMSSTVASGNTYNIKEKGIKWRRDMESQMSKPESIASHNISIQSS